MDIKKELRKMCMEYAQKRVATAKEALQEAKEAANEESKSSVGDKYETGRAMMHLEQEKHAVQLEEAIKLQKAMDKVMVLNTNEIEVGSLVITNRGNFYIAISAGKLTVEGKDYFAIAPASPIGLHLLDKKVGNKIQFNNNELEILEVI